MITGINLCCKQLLTGGGNKVDEVLEDMMSIIENKANPVRDEMFIARM